MPFKAAPDAKFPEVEELKTQGNNFFKLELYDQAVIMYSEAIAVMEKVIETSGKAPEVLCDWRSSGLIGIRETGVSRVSLSNSKFSRFQAEHTDVLSKLFNNRATAHGKAENLNEAYADATRALQLDPRFVKAHHRYWSFEGAALVVV